MKFNSRYSVTGEKSGIKFDQPSQTLQSFKDDADINCIIARFEHTGVLVDSTVSVSRTPQFGDYSDMPTYQEAQNVIVAANNAFSSLSSKIRERFGNDPAAYFDFVQSLKKEVMIMLKQLGLELLTNLLTVLLKYLPDLLKVPVKK